MIVRQRGSDDKRATIAVIIARYAAVAATVPIPWARRVFTRPAKGSLTMMTSCGAKLWCEGALTGYACRTGLALSYRRWIFATGRPAE